MGGRHLGRRLAGVELGQQLGLGDADGFGDDRGVTDRLGVAPSAVAGTATRGGGRGRRRRRWGCCTCGQRPKDRRTTRAADK